MTENKRKEEKTSKLLLVFLVHGPPPPPKSPSPSFGTAFINALLKTDEHKGHHVAIDKINFSEDQRDSRHPDIGITSSENSTGP